jgi:tetratricopeptide (TPR) repeat protein
MMRGARQTPDAAAAGAAAKLIALSQTGNWAQLEFAADRVTRQFAALPLGWRALGLAQLQMGKAADAVVALTRAAKLAPGDAKIHNDIGVAQMTLGQKRNAAASYRRAIERDPRFAEAAANLGWLLCDLGETAEGVAYCRRAVALNPASAVAHNNLGIGLRDLGDVPGAEAAYRQALALQPVYLEAQVNLGTLLSDVKRMDEALACYRQAVRENPSALPALNALGKLLSRHRVGAQRRHGLQRTRQRADACRAAGRGAGHVPAGTGVAAADHATGDAGISGVFGAVPRYAAGRVDADRLPGGPCRV